MKFTLAVIVAAAASMADGFAPIATPKTSRVTCMATETSTKPYTFTKSEEIFAEAQTVSHCTANLTSFSSIHLFLSL